MGLSPAGLRKWIVVFAVGLVAAIAIFLVYGRWQGRRLGRDLPYGLGSSIQQSTNGFTYSESRGGHTIYTLHASKAVQYKADGHLELHDVSITLYGAQGAAANRIYGSEFDWDPAKGVARAMGEVQIDFQGSAGGGQGKTSTDEGESRSTVHVKTSGLSFNKQTGVAETAEKLEFRLAEAAGSAVGASFDSQKGVLVLTSEVAFNSSVGGSPLAIRAHHAQFDRDSRLLYLLQDVTDYQDSHSSSDQAIVSFRPDSTAYQVEAEGNVILTGGYGQQIKTRKVHVDLGPRSEPEQAIVSGGLYYVANSPARLLHGSASSATLSFNAQPTIRHAQFRDAVSLVDEEKLPPVSGGKGNQPESTSRQLQGTKVDVGFSPDADKRPQAQQILAEGGARLNIHTIYAKTPPQDTTVQADELFATLKDGEVLSTLRGTGHTSLVEVSPSGVKQSSTGDQMLLTFASPQKFTVKTPGKADVPMGHAAARLQTALQTGNVTITQETQPDTSGKGGNSTPAVTTATADRAAYDAPSEVVQLSGNPRIRDANGELNAAAVEVHRTTGDADATGGVKATYRQASGSPGGGQPATAFAGAGPVHVVADRAHLDHATGLTTFFGKGANQARLWQGSDSIAAPVLELSRPHATLEAHGAGVDSAVNAVFTSVPSQAAVARGTGQGSQPSVVRLNSRTLSYAENDHQAMFSGGVVAQTATGTLRANAMDIYFTPVAGAATRAGAGGPVSSQMASGQVSKMVARGDVRLEQPGRKGTGEELTYTSADARFVLQGTSAAPPRLSDQVRGTVTGSALIFNDRDDSVVVSGGASKAVTQTHVAK